MEFIFIVSRSRCLLGGALVFQVLLGLCGVAEGAQQLSVEPTVWASLTEVFAHGTAPPPAGDRELAAQVATVLEVFL